MKLCLYTILYRSWGWTWGHCNYIEGNGSGGEGKEEKVSRPTRPSHIVVSSALVCYKDPSTSEVSRDCDLRNLGIS
jgi:hypothetical protein